MKSKQILIIEDHFVVRAGTTVIINNKYPEIMISYAETYPEALQKLKERNYDLILLDINIPDGKQKKMIKEIKEIQKETKILIFSAYEEDVALQYILEGADGYISKLNTEEEILKAIEDTITYGSFYSRKIVDKILKIKANKNTLEVNPFNKLSEREMAVANLLIKGYGNIEISNNLDLQLSTVSTYKRRIFKKLNITNSIDLHTLYLKYNGNLTM